MTSLERRATLAAALLSLGAATRAAMVDPAADPDHLPFTYFAKPTTVIGVQDDHWKNAVPLEAEWPADETKQGVNTPAVRRRNGDDRSLGDERVSFATYVV